MASIKIKHKGNFKKTDNFLSKMLHMDNLSVLQKFGQRGVEALAATTPVDTGKTAASWSYYIENKNNGNVAIYWTNSNVVKGVNIAIILQYGHGTRQGGYVEGRDYINPALQPLFDEMANEIWREVSSK